MEWCEDISRTSKDTMRLVTSGVVRYGLLPVNWILSLWTFLANSMSLIQGSSKIFPQCGNLLKFRMLPSTDDSWRVNEMTYSVRCDLKCASQNHDNIGPQSKFEFGVKSSFCSSDISENKSCKCFSELTVMWQKISFHKVLCPLSHLAMFFYLANVAPISSSWPLFTEHAAHG